MMNINGMCKWKFLRMEISNPIVLDDLILSFIFEKKAQSAIDFDERSFSFRIFKQIVWQRI